MKRSGYHGRDAGSSLSLISFFLFLSISLYSQPLLLAPGSWPRASPHRPTRLPCFLIFAKLTLLSGTLCVRLLSQLTDASDEKRAGTLTYRFHFSVSRQSVSPVRHPSVFDRACLFQIVRASLPLRSTDSKRGYQFRAMNSPQGD